MYWNQETTVLKTGTSSHRIVAVHTETLYTLKHTHKIHICWSEYKKYLTIFFFLKGIFSINANELTAFT